MTTSSPGHATIKDVARAAGVSTGTVSNLINDTKRVGPQTAERITRAISELGFVPNSAVRVIMGGRTHAVGLLVPDATNPFFADVAQGIEDVTFSEDLMVVVCNTMGDPEREEHYTQALAEMRVRGAIALATDDDQYLARLARTGARVVTLGTPSGGRDFSNVAISDDVGGYLAVKHLIDRGHRRIALVGGAGAQHQIRERFAGAERAMRESGLDPAEAPRIYVPSATLGDRMDAGRRLIELSPRPTAAFCASDQLALAIEAYVLQAGLVIPDDLALVGYDDIEGAALAARPLTTIRQPQREIGVAAATLVLRGEQETPESITFDPELVVRQSS